MRRWAGANDGGSGAKTYADLPKDMSMACFGSPAGTPEAVEDPMLKDMVRCCGEGGWPPVAVVGTERERRSLVFVCVFVLYLFLFPTSQECSRLHTIAFSWCWRRFSYLASFRREVEGNPILDRIVLDLGR